MYKKKHKMNFKKKLYSNSLNLWLDSNYSKSLSIMFQNLSLFDSLVNSIAESAQPLFRK
jgi:hypothetical protein